MLLKLGTENDSPLFYNSCFVMDAPFRFQDRASIIHRPDINRIRSKTAVQPFATSVIIHIFFVFLLFIAASQSNSMLNDLAGKTGDDMSVIMVEFDDSGLAAGEAAVAASQASSSQQTEEIVEPPVQMEEPEPVAPLVEEASAVDTPLESPTVVEEPVNILAVQERELPPPVVKTPPIKKTETVVKKDRPVKPKTKNVTTSTTDSVNATSGMGGEAKSSQPGSSNAGNAAQGANTANSNRVTALSRKVHYPPKATSLRIEGKVKIRFDITDKGSVTNIRILSEDPVGIFAESVIKDMARWKYKTDQQAANQTVSIVFKLNGSIRINQ